MSDNEIILETKDLSKRYGLKNALVKATMQLEKGKILGLMGPNGSGKTTFLKILACLLHPTSGDVKICGFPCGIETKKRVAFLADCNSIFPWMTVTEAINYYDDFFEDFDSAKAFDMLDFMKLEKDEKVRNMSKGMIEKLNLVLTFSRNAKLFVLDEPLGGVDPVARERIISTIIKTYNEDSSIIISTHLVHDVESIFDKVCFIKNGEIVLQGDAEDLRADTGLSIDQLYIKTFSDM